MTEIAKRHPVILFPGIAGSQLKTRKAGSQNAHPLWSNPIVMSFLDDGDDEASSNTVSDQDDFTVASASIVESDKSEADLGRALPLPISGDWKEHMKLQADGIIPIKEGNSGEKFNREVEGLKGIKNVHYPKNPDKEPNPGNNYYQALVDQLTTELGYIEKVNLIDKNEDLVGHPYDWRVAPGGLEKRYETFTKLKQKIEDLYNNRNLPVVLIAHSMGNRLVQYFLKWIETNESQAWIDKHIERYIAISPPWIGAPQAIYRLSDSKIVLPAGLLQISLGGMKEVMQSFSSIPWLFPVEGQYQYFNTENKEGIGYIFGYFANSASLNLADYQPITVQETLEKAQAQTTTLKHQTTFYQNDPLITDRTSRTIGSELVKCPPVKKLDVIYSTGFDTPVGAYYQYNGTLQIATNLGSEKKPIPYPQKPGLVIKSGIIEETPATEQQIEVQFSDRTRLQNSGDVVVPYGSLTYFKKWKKENPKKYIEGHEFSCLPTAPGGERDKKLNHNAIVAHPRVITKIIQLLSESNA